MPVVLYVNLLCGGCPFCDGHYLESRYTELGYTIRQCLKCGYGTKEFSNPARKARVPPKLKPFAKRVAGAGKKAQATWWPTSLTTPIEMTMKPPKRYWIPWRRITPVIIRGRLNWRRTDYTRESGGRLGWTRHSMDHPRFLDAMKVSAEQNVLLSAAVSRPGRVALLGGPGAGDKE